MGKLGFIGVLSLALIALSGRLVYTANRAW